MDAGWRFHGVDFSGAASPRRKVWVARDAPGEPARAASGLDYLELVEAIASSGADGLRHAWLIDAPLGLSVKQLESSGVAPDWLASLRWLASFGDPREWRRACRRISRKEPRRACDERSRTPLPPSNLRMFKQTWHAMGSVVAPLLAREDVLVLPMGLGARGARGEDADRVLARARVWVGEGCPSATLQHLGWPHRGYKGSADRNRTLRSELLARLREEAGVDVAEETARRAADDPEGDVLDSLLLLAAARRFAQADHARIFQEDPLARVEGWVYV